MNFMNAVQSSRFLTASGAVESNHVGAGLDQCLGCLKGWRDEGQAIMMAKLVNANDWHVRYTTDGSNIGWPVGANRRCATGHSRRGKTCHEIGVMEDFAFPGLTGNDQPSLDGSGDLTWCHAGNLVDIPQSTITQ